MLDTKSTLISPRISWLVAFTCAKWSRRNQVDTVYIIFGYGVARLDSSHTAQTLLRETGPCSSVLCFQLSRLPLLRFLSISYKQVSTKTSRKSQVPLLGFFLTSNKEPSTGTRSSTMRRCGAALTELADIRAYYLKIHAILILVIPSPYRAILSQLYNVQSILLTGVHHQQQDLMDK